MSKKSKAKRRAAKQRKEDLKAAPKEMGRLYGMVLKRRHTIVKWEQDTTKRIVKFYLEHGQQVSWTY